MLKTEKSFRNPIYMAFKIFDTQNGLYPRCLPVIQHSLVNYRNVFLSSEKSKTQSFYVCATSNLNDDVMEYLMAYFTHPFFYKFEYIEQKFANVIDENPEVLKLLKFYLEYVAANYRQKFVNMFELHYTFLYHVFNKLPTKLNGRFSCWAAKQAGEIIDSIEKEFKFCSGNGFKPLKKKIWEEKNIYYGIHSILLSE